MSAASAPGKMMLFGEYAVLEGHPSVALCFDRRIRCEAEEHARVRVEAPGVFGTVEVDASFGTCPDERLRLLWPLLVAHGRGVRLSFEAGFPPTWGLGSSSASTLAASAALRDLRGEAWDAEGIFTEVWHAQRALQGAASGYDVATQLEGGLVAYTVDGPRRPLPIPDGRWSVAWTGTKAKTGSMITRVRERFEVGHAIYSRIGALARRALAAIEAGAALGSLLNEGHALLDELGAIPEHLHAVVRALQSDPAVLGARMCGAGGGDSVLILSDDPERAGRAAARHGLELLPIQPTADGLRLESTP